MSDSASATQIRARTCSWPNVRAQIATSSGPRYWIRSAIPICEPVDREEVEELHERDADDAEDGEPEQLATIDAQRAAASGRGR